MDGFCIVLTFSFVSVAANLCSSQAASPNLKKPAGRPSTYLSKECGVSFQYPPTMVVVQIPAETSNDEEPDICCLAIQGRNQATKRRQPNPTIHIARGSLESIAKGEGLIRDPEHPGLWTFANWHSPGQGEDEKGANWQGVHASYAIRLFDDKGYYQGMGDAERIIACNGVDRCILFDTEDLGYPTFNLIRKTLRFLSAHE